MSQPMVHSFHVIFNTTKFHFNRNMDNTLKFTVMKTGLYAIILTIFIYITHVHLFCLFSKTVHSPRKGAASELYSTNQEDNSATWWIFCKHKVSSLALKCFRITGENKIKPNQEKANKKIINKQICLRKMEA